MDQDVVPWFDACSMNESRVARGCGHHQPGRVEEAPFRRHGTERGFACTNVRGEGTLDSAEDAVAGFMKWGVRGWSRDNGASEFGAGYPRERGLVLVDASDLEQVEEIDGAGVDGD